VRAPFGREPTAVLAKAGATASVKKVIIC